MCSNTGSTSACGCGSGGNGVSMWSSGLKKQQKRPRVPKRGPGVAELEKILREQETIDITDRGNNAEGFSIPSPCFIPHNPNHYPLKPHPRPTSPPSSGRINVPSAPKFDHLCTATPPTMTSMYGNSGPLLGRNGNGGGSGLVSQEQELFPMNFNSLCKSKPNLNEGVDGSQSDHSGNSPSSESNPAWSYPPTIQKRNNNQFPPPMMNQFLGASTLASSGSLSMGLHNHLEPPSNQSSYYHYTSRIPEENKMVGMKRSHSLSLDNSLIPPSNFQVLPSFSRYNRSHQSSTNDNQGLSSFNSTNECYRDAKWGTTLELSSRRFNSDIVGPGHGHHGHANFPPFVTPEVPPPPMHLFQGVLSKGKVLPCQVIEDKKMEDLCQRSESSGPDRRPFYNFLEVNDPNGMTEATRDSNHGGREARRGGLDLSLKL